MGNSKGTVLITGCSDGGIGAALAKAFHSKGYQVIATVRSPKKAASLKSLGLQVLQLDVTSAESIEHCVAEVSALTNGTLDILINNAGYGLSLPITDTSTAAARELFDTNFFGALNVIQAIMPLLISTANSSSTPPMIVNNTSIVGVIPIPWQGVYNASKAALASLTDTLRLELQGFGINVVDLKTGAVASEFFNNINQGNKAPLPPTSIFSPAAAIIASLQSHTDIQKTAVSPTSYAENVVADLLSSRSKPPVQIWRGGNAFIVWLGRRFLPFTAMDGNMRKMGRVGEVEAAIRSG